MPSQPSSSRDDSSASMRDTSFGAAGSPRQSSYPPSTSPIERLPLEVKDQIVSHLHKSDHHALARTCRALQSTAEARIWRTVDLSLPTNWECQHHTVLWRNIGSTPAGTLPGPEKKSLVHKLKSRGHDWSAAPDEDVNVERTHVETIWRIFKLESRARSVIRAIQSRPDRGKSINELILSLPSPDIDLKSDNDSPSQTKESGQLEPIVNGVVVDHPRANKRIFYHLEEWRSTLSTLVNSLVTGLEVIRIVSYEGTTYSCDPTDWHSDTDDSEDGTCLLPYDQGSNNPFGWLGTYGIVAPLPRLKVLEIPATSNHRSSVRSDHFLDLFKATSTDLSHLIIAPPWPARITDGISTSSGSSEVSSSSAGSARLASSNDIPHLESITTRSMHRTSLVPLSHLISASSHLRSLGVSFPESEAPPDGPTWYAILEQMNANKSLDAFRNIRTLRHLGWTGGMRARLFFEKLSEKGFDSVETLVQSQSVECESETYIENIHIPPFPSLRSILVPCRLPTWRHHRTAPGWAKAAPPAGSVSSSVVSHLHHARNLLGVQFGHQDDPGIQRVASYISTEDVLDSARWCPKRVNGVLIRTYLDQGTDEELYHLRRLELLGMVSRGPSRRDRDRGYERKAAPHVCTGDHRLPHVRAGKKVVNLDSVAERRMEGDHIWHEHTSFRGATVPPQVLKKVYKLAQTDLEWTRPGRGLELPFDAWEVLRKWRATLPDRGEVERERIVTRSMVASAP